MSRIPKHCPDHNNRDPNPLNGGGSVQGDTRACRTLHLNSAGLRPQIHCPHLADVSEMCYLELCPKAERLTEPDKVFNQEFSGSPSSTVRFVLIEIVAILFVVGLASMIWFRRARRLSFANWGLEQETAEHLTSDKDDVRRPIINMADMALNWRNAKDPHKQDTIIEMKQEFLGGCKLTGIVGESGAGKTSFLRLLAGFEAPHMTLHYRPLSTAPQFAFCPQTPEMWPKEMPVRDILLFACEMVGTKPSQFQMAFERIGIIDEMLDKRFGELSGGQQQRVNIAACLVRPDPSIIILDEPLASLDEENSIAILEVLKNLPIKHAFVMTVHRPSDTVESQFDRLLSFDSKRQYALVETIPCRNKMKLLSMSEQQPVTPAIPSQWSKSIRASFILWHGQFYGLPAVEVVMGCLSIVAAIFTALIARPSLVDVVSKAK